jgi:Holliday junction resolvase RusA-like endonuclease
VKIVLSGEPKSTQHIYRYACRGSFASMYMTAEGKAIKEAYHWEAKSQWRAKPLSGDISVTIEFFFATKRRRDLDNQNKLVLDALSGIVYEDDAQIAELHLLRRHDTKRPRIEVSVT